MLIIPRITGLKPRRGVAAQIYNSTWPGQIQICYEGCLMIQWAGWGALRRPRHHPVGRGKKRSMAIGMLPEIVGGKPDRALMGICSPGRFIPNRDGVDLQASFSLLHADGSPSSPTKAKKKVTSGELHYQKGMLHFHAYSLDLPRDIRLRRFALQRKKQTIHFLHFSAPSSSMIRFPRHLHPTSPPGYRQSQITHPGHELLRRRMDIVLSLPLLPQRIFSPICPQRHTPHAQSTDRQWIREQRYIH